MRQILPLFVDTTILVDRVLEPPTSDRRQRIEQLLAGFEYRLCARYSRLEFKRVVIQNLGLALRYVLEEGSFVGAWRRSSNLYKSRRAQTLANIFAFVERGVDRNVEVIQGESADQQLTLQAIAYIRNSIRKIWYLFQALTDSIVDQMECKRATEAPVQKGDGALDTSIPKSRCKNRECNNANFFRSQLPKIEALVATLEQVPEHALTDELRVALQVMKQSIRDPVRLYDYKCCLQIGDVWLHLEALKAGVKDFATRNYKESAVLCPALGLTMHDPEEQPRRT